MQIWVFFSTSVNFSQLKLTLFNFSQLTLCPLCKCDPGVSIIPVFCDRGFLKLSCASVAKSWSLFRLPLRSDTREKKNFIQLFSTLVNFVQLESTNTWAHLAFGYVQQSLHSASDVAKSERLCNSISTKHGQGFIPSATPESQLFST